MGTPTLRERQAEQVRVGVLDAVVAQLEQRPVDDIAMADVAAEAGISLRTLYRYFPDREALLHAAGEHLYRDLGIGSEIVGPQDISASFRDAAAKLASRPALARALVRTTAGRAARSATRVQRVEAIGAALAPLTEGLDPDHARRATAVIAHLCSAASWVAVSDDSGLDDEDAQQAVAWAIDALLQMLQSQPPAPAPGRRTKHT
ncbi:MAG TPA: TetR/AcrR family transcriptional regulator [Mycobacteriales bacterium]|nr:TetR/AcrR family transcriptional regulator [Mycobacteriales bacterium]